MILGVPEIFDEVSNVMLSTKFKIEAIQYHHPEIDVSFMERQLETTELLIDALNEIGKIAHERDNEQIESLTQLNLRLSESMNIIINTLLCFIDMSSSKDKNGKQALR